MFSKCFKFGFIPALIGLVLIGNYLSSQTPPPPVPVVFDSSKRLYWEHSGLDVLGQPEVLSSAEVQIFDSAGVMVAGSSAPALPPLTGFDDRALLSSLPGGNYQIKVRVFDIAGNVSDFSAPLDIRIDKTKPTSPINPKRK